MPKKSLVTIIADTQTIEVEGWTPGVSVSTAGTKVFFPLADGRVVSSSIRAFQDRFDIQSLQTPPNSWVLLQKTDS